jgi:hypothetical protein
MANHDIDWVPKAHMCFESLNFTVTTEGKLDRALATQPPRHRH